MEEESNRCFFDAIDEPLKEKRIQALQNLIEKGTNVNSYNSDGHYALMEAASHGYVDCVRLLLEAGTNVNELDAEGETALIHCFSNFSNFFEVSSEDRLNCVSVLVESGADLYHQSDISGITPLMAACYLCDDQCVKFILEKGYKKDSNIDDTQELFKSSASLQAPDLKRCQSASSDWKSDKENTNKCCKMDAASVDDGGIKNSVDAASVDDGGIKNSVDAASGDDRGIKNSVDAASGDDGGIKNSVDAASGDDKTSLMIDDPRDIEVTDFIECRNALTHCLNSDACGPSQVKTLKLLVEAGVNVNVKEGQFTALNLAITSYPNSIHMARMLLAAGADFYPNDLVDAVIVRNVELLQLFLDMGANINQKHRYGYSLIHTLISEKNTDNKTKACLKLLIDAGADINSQNDRKFRPIHYALKIWPCFKFPAEYLISENCDLSTASYDQIQATFFRDNLNEEYKLDILKLLFACGLPRHLCQSFIFKQETLVRNWVETVANQPNSLLSICVFEVRRTLGLAIKSKVQSLSLPNVIQSLILRQGILSSECFM